MSLLKILHSKMIEEDDATDDSNAFEDKNSSIKSKIASGKLRVSSKRGRSMVWNTFGRIETESGEELENLVACRVCRNIYKYNRKSTSNLVKHKCYVINAEVSKKTKVEADPETKKNVAQILTNWSIENCRPFQIVEDSGLKKVADFFISIGAKHGDLDVNSVLPHPTTISRNVHKIYQTCFQEVASEISSIKNNGFALSSNLWTDNYLRKSFLALTMYYVKDGNLVSRLLGIRTMKGEMCTNENIILEVNRVLKEFDCNLNENAIIVTDGASSMNAAFRNYNHICSIDHLIHNAVQKSIAEITVVADLCATCIKLVKYFKTSGLNSKLATSLKSYCPTQWNAIYLLLISIADNWPEFVKVLQENGDMHIIGNINLGDVNGIIKILEHFQDALKVLQEDKRATLYLVIVYIHRLKKKCTINSEDSAIVKILKEKLVIYLDSLVTENLTIFHKVALFLFPPANKLIQFDENDKHFIKSECKRLMQSYIGTESVIENQIDPIIKIEYANTNDVFSDFISQPDDVKILDKIRKEIEIYERINVMLHDDFNVLQWWNLNKNDFPLLFKTSCKILATPASSAFSEKTFSLARNLISDKISSIGSNDTSVSQLMFLHSNIEDSETIQAFMND